MTASTIPGDHLTSEDAGSSDSNVGSEPSTRTRAVVQVARNGNLSYYADGDIDFLVIDERCPRDMPGTEAAILAFLNGEPAPKPKLTLIQREDER